MSMRFVDILAHLKTQIETISTADGFHTDLGQAVYLEGIQPLPQDDDGNIPVRSVVIDPGDIEQPDDAEVRQGTVVREAMLTRTVSVIVVWPLPDKTGWLTLSEQLFADLRKAISKDPAQWGTLGVKRWGIGAVESDRPGPGAQALSFKADFILQYID